MYAIICVGGDIPEIKREFAAFLVENKDKFANATRKNNEEQNITANSFLQDFVNNITQVKYLLNFELTMLEVFGNFRCTKVTVSGKEKKRLEENLHAFGQMKYKKFSSVCHQSARLLT